MVKLLNASVCLVSGAVFTHVFTLKGKYRCGTLSVQIRAYHEHYHLVGGRGRALGQAGFGKCGKCSLIGDVIALIQLHVRAGWGKCGKAYAILDDIGVNGRGQILTHSTAMVQNV